MKYKVITPKKVLSIKKLDIESLRLGISLSIIKPSKATTPIAINIIKPKALGYEPSKDLPLLLKKPLSLSKVVREFLFTKYGTPSIVLHEQINAAIEYFSSNWRVDHKPKVIPTQNIKFQKLSLFILASMKPCLRGFGLSYMPPYSLGTTPSEAGVLSVFKTSLAGLVKSLIKLKLDLNSKFKVYSSNILKLFSRSKALLFIVSGIFWYFESNVAYASESLVATISKTENQYAIPSGLLLAIAKVESGKKPYALNIAGKTIVAGSKEEAIKTVQYYLNQGYTNIDLGIMQVNFRWHGNQFSSIEQMLTPEHNIHYGAKLLTSLYKQYGSWSKAVRYYHSATTKRQRQYSRKVLVSWLEG